MPEEAGLNARLAQLDPQPGVRGHQFERLCRWFLLSGSDPHSVGNLRFALALESQFVSTTDRGGQALRHPL